MRPAYEIDDVIVIDGELRTRASKTTTAMPHARFATNDLALQDVAADYLKTKAFKVTGDISAATVKTIQNVLMEGVKTSKTFADSKKAIYKALESEGLLTEEDVRDALGTVTVKDTKARMETIVRTNTFEAINEARYQFFSDPEMDGFVEALEYSAVMDDRTTDICQQLDGQTFGIDDEIWATYRPPNHFNCRSILVPVTARDTWTRSDDPSVLPQKGFGFEREQPNITVHVQPPSVTVTPEITVNLPESRMNFSEMQPPVVHVNVQPPQVVVQPPQVTVENNVDVPPTNVTLEATLPQPDITVHIPPRETMTKINYNNAGDIDTVYQKETDLG